MTTAGGTGAVAGSGAVYIACPIFCSHFRRGVISSEHFYGLLDSDLFAAGCWVRRGCEETSHPRPLTAEQALAGLPVARASAAAARDCAGVSARAVRPGRQAGPTSVQ